MNMKTSTKFEPMSALKTRSAALLKRVRETGQPVVITRRGRPAAILEDVEAYERQRRAFLLLTLLSQAERDIQKGRTVSHAEAKDHFKRVLRMLKTRGKAV